MVTIWVGDAAHHEIAHPDKQKCVKYQVVHDGCVGYFCFAEPAYLWANKVQHRENCTVQSDRTKYKEPNN